MLCSLVGVASVDHGPLCAKLCSLVGVASVDHAHICFLCAEFWPLLPAARYHSLQTQPGLNRSSQLQAQAIL